MGPNLLNFNWNISASNYSECPLNVITYNIKALNCGSCPTTTNHTNATCKYTSNAGTRCVFTLKFVMCGRDFQESITADIPPSTNASKYNIILYQPGYISCIHPIKYTCIFDDITIIQILQYYPSSLLSAF